MDRGKYLINLIVFIINVYKIWMVGKFVWYKLYIRNYELKFYMDGGSNEWFLRVGFKYMDFLFYLGFIYKYVLFYFLM